jgi:hypothetical protein
VRDHDGPCPAGGTPPGIGCAEKLRVQRAAVLRRLRIFGQRDKLKANRSKGA